MYGSRLVKQVRSTREVTIMTLLWIGVAVLLLVALDVVAMRYGADSRHADDSRRDWW